MFPKLSQAKPLSYPKEALPSQSNNFLKLKFLKEFLDQDPATNDKEMSLGKLSHRANNKENNHKRHNTSNLIKNSHSFLDTKKYPRESHSKDKRRN